MIEKISGWKTIFGLSVFWWAGVVGSASWADDRINSEFKVTSIVTLTKNEQRAVSLAAGEILNHVQQARADIQYNDVKNALTHVEKGLTLVRIVEGVLPEYSVYTHIKSGGVTYKEEEKRKQFVVLMYGELDQVFGITPLIRRAKRGAIARESSESGAETELPYTASFLDVRDAKYYLEQAEAAVKKGDSQKADKALASIQEHVIFQYDVIDVPLATARRSLLEAAGMVVANNYSRARQELLRAAASLEVYRNQVGPGVDKELDAILTDIKRLTGTLEEKKQGTAETIQNLWKRVTNLT